MSDINNLKNLDKIYKKNYNQKCKLYKNMKIANKHELSSVRRIIVIGDLHGDWNQTIESLKLAKVIDYNEEENKINWIGGDTVIVQVGDQIDRCRELPCSRTIESDENSDVKILKFFTTLHNKAMKDGGAVYSIIGNHELMNVTGRMEYVSKMNADAFELDEGNKQFLKGVGKKLTDMEARKWAFQPGHPLAEFLACTRKLTLKIGRNLFVHAGILKEISQEYSLKQLNEVLSLYLLNKLPGKKEKYISILGPDIIKNITSKTKDNSHICQGNECFHISPLWNRKIGNIDNSEESCNLLLNQVLEDYDVDRMIVGHTPQLNTGITSKCNDRIWFVDYGASDAFNIADNIYQTTNERSDSRKTQVLEILRDGEEINVLKN